MIVNQLQTLHERHGDRYQSLCAAATVTYPTFMRWKGRLGRGEPVLCKPGPKPIVAADLSGLQAQLRRLEHGRHRSHGTAALYQIHRESISRRGFQQFVEESRREILRERQADTRRIDWRVPGAVWSMDPTELTWRGDELRQKLRLLPVMDLASRYKFPPWVGQQLTGDQVAAHLEELFHRYDPPLVLKRDNGSNLNDAAVDELLNRWLVIPLNSPPHYPPYNGGMERAQREFKTVLRPQLLADPRRDPAGLALLTIHELNHQPRRCLRGQTACEQFAGAKLNLGGYTRRRRKEMFEQISELAMTKMLELPVRPEGCTDTIWRRAVETWLQQQEIIRISEPKSVTQFP